MAPTTALKGTLLRDTVSENVRSQDNRFFGLGRLRVYHRNSAESGLLGGVGMARRLLYM
jgi:hypothetical protein